MWACNHLSTLPPSTLPLPPYPPGKVIASTVVENASLLERLLGVRPTPFRPSIPHLVYQYALFTNFDPSPDALGRPNPEVPEEDG